MLLILVGRPPHSTNLALNSQALEAFEHKPGSPARMCVLYGDANSCSHDLCASACV